MFLLLTKLWASIGVTRSYSSCPFLRSLASTPAGCLPPCYLLLCELPYTDSQAQEVWHQWRGGATHHSRRARLPWVPLHPGQLTATAHTRGVCVCVCLCLCVCACVCVCTHACVHACVCMHVYMHVCACMCVASRLVSDGTCLWNVWSSNTSSWVSFVRRLPRVVLYHSLLVNFSSPLGQ